jgi:hypothetical protein
VFNVFSARLPKDCASENALRNWRDKEDKRDPK